MMENTNEMTIIFDSRPVNEALARVAVASFCTQLNPTLEEISDLKTAVSEAVTNCIIHGYEGEIHKIRVECRLRGQELQVDVTDHGAGIPDIKKAMEPLFTTKAIKTAPVWGLHSWRRLWMSFRWNRRLAVELQCT